MGCSAGRSPACQALVPGTRMRGAWKNNGQPDGVRELVPTKVTRQRCCARHQAESKARQSDESVKTLIFHAGAGSAYWVRRSALGRAAKRATEFTVVWHERYYTHPWIRLISCRCTMNPL